MNAKEIITRDQFKELFDKYIENYAKETNIDLTQYEYRRAAEYGVMRTIIMHFISDQERTEVMKSLNMIKNEYQVIEFTEADAITGRMVLSSDTKYRADLFAEQYAAEMGTTVKVVEKLIFL